MTKWLNPVAFVCVIGMCLGCSARVDIVMAPDGSAAVEFKTTGQETVFRNLVRKAAAFSGEEPPADASGLVNEAAIRQGFKARSDLALHSLEKTDAVSVKGKASAPHIDRVGLDSADPKASPFFRLERSASSTTLSFRLDRSNAERLPDLMPGLDPDLLDLLGPPAIFGDELSAEEYRMNLQPFLGKANMPALDSSAFELRIRPPGTPPAKVIAYSGGTLEGGILVAKASLLELLVLEKPVELSLSWVP